MFREALVYRRSSRHRELDNAFVNRNTAFTRSVWQSWDNPQACQSCFCLSGKTSTRSQDLISIPTAGASLVTVTVNESSSIGRSNKSSSPLSYFATGYKVLAVLKATPNAICNAQSDH